MREEKEKKRSVSPPQNVSWEGNLPTTNCCGDPSNSRQDEKSENGGRWDKTGESAVRSQRRRRHTGETQGEMTFQSPSRLTCCMWWLVCVLGEATLWDDGSEYIERLILQHQRGSEVGKTFLGAARLPHLHNKQVFRMPEETGEVNRKQPFFFFVGSSRQQTHKHVLWFMEDYLTDGLSFIFLGG